MSEQDKTYPEGHFLGMWMGIGIAFFAGVGVPLSIIFGIPGLIGIGPAIGVAFGLSIGQYIENKYKQQGLIRPLTEAEQKRKRYAILAGLFLLLVGLIVSILIFLL